ncbi:MAG: 23S rRNA (uracil(1939)-C(5))-methyltransferase RlmD [Candidatus Zixiibacteriota bacterium]
MNLDRPLHQLTIEDLAFDGKAVAHLDGKVVFLDSGLPGETVLAEITRSHPRYSQGLVREITSRSPQRIQARCLHFGTCGGCSWQDLAYSEQLAFKKRHVVECLARIGGLREAAVRDVLPCSNVFEYRNKMEFSFHALEEGGFHLGLHRRGRFDDIFDLHACHLQDDMANRIVGSVRDFVKREQVPVYDVTRHTGYMRFLIVRRGLRTGQTMVNIVTNRGPFSLAERLVSELLESFPRMTTIIHGQNGSKSNIATAETESVLFGPGYIEEKILGLTFRIRANSFFQTNTEQAELLYQAGFELLKPLPSDRLLDLYCGTGTIGHLLAPRVSEVVGVEIVPDAVTIARENASVNGIVNVTFLQANVAEYLRGGPEHLRDFDAFIIDPPRAGLHPKALKRILALAPARLLYYSCNPATFARDAQALCDRGYRMSEVQPVDMFPHTRHIELVALFSR